MTPMKPIFMKHRFLTLALISFLALSPQAADAAGGPSEPLKKVDWHFEGPFGTFDRAALQRGLKVYREVCSACHSMKRIAFRNLTDLGYTEDQVKNIASEYTVIDGPDDEGEMFERPARPSDRFPSPYPNDKAAAAANGAVPPDMSLIIKARADGANYMYSLLTGYTQAPEGKELGQNQHYNKYMPGNIIAMAAPLMDGQVAYEDGSPETVSQYAKDVTEFLKWAAEPTLERRKQMGINVLIFLTIFAGIMYAYKKKIWLDVKKAK